MYTIKENTNYLYEIKKSKFYVNLYKVNTIDDIDKYLKEIKNIYKDATHYCYAYKLGSIKKCSDDGEPSGTAGMPILEVLDKKDLDYVLCIVTRYFGGIKLGAGGLIRAYANSVNEAILKQELIELIRGYLIEIEATYDNKKDIEYIFKDNIMSTNYQDKIIYQIKIKQDDLDKLNTYNYKIIEEIWY